MPDAHPGIYPPWDDPDEEGVAHGTVAGYVHHGCRCLDCKAARAAYARDMGHGRTLSARESKRRYDRSPRATEMRRAREARSRVKG